MPDTKIRLDKWLWAARFFKTRSLATKAIEQGKVLYNGQKTRPSRAVQINDAITIPQGFVKKTVTVCDLAEKRGSAQVAQSLYQETQESIQAREETLAKRQLRRLEYATDPKPASRPDKHARKAIQKIRGKD